MIMFNEYIEKVMQHAHYEQLEDGTYFGRIPGFKGVWAKQLTELQCREELREILEGWILLNIDDHTSLPRVDGMTWEVGKSVSCSISNSQRYFQNGSRACSQV